MLNGFQDFAVELLNLDNRIRTRQGGLPDIVRGIHKVFEQTAQHYATGPGEFPHGVYADGNLDPATSTVWASLWIGQLPVKTIPAGGGVGTDSYFGPCMHVAECVPCGGLVCVVYPYRRDAGTIAYTDLIDPGEFNEQRLRDWLKEFFDHAKLSHPSALPDKPEDDERIGFAPPRDAAR